MENISLNSNPLVLRNYISDVEFLASWKDIEFCINNPWQYGPSIIHKKLTTKVPLKTDYSFWFGRPIPDKRQVMDYVNQGHTLVLENYSVHSVATHEICKRIETILDVTADMHVHCSLDKSESYPIHCDHSVNFIIQVLGETHWKVFDKQGDPVYNKTITEADAGDAIIDTVLKPGDILFIPAKTYHKAIPFEKRISISIPCAVEHKPINRSQLKINEISN